MTVAELSNCVANGDLAVAPRQAGILPDEGNGVGGARARGDIMRGLKDRPTGPVLGAADTPVAGAYPDQTLKEAVSTMLVRDVGRLPVVERSGSRKVIGYLGRAEILAARFPLHEDEKLREKGPSLASVR